MKYIFGILVCSLLASCSNEITNLHSIKKEMSEEKVKEIIKRENPSASEAKEEISVQNGDAIKKFLYKNCYIVFKNGLVVGWVEYHHGSVEIKQNSFDLPNFSNLKIYIEYTRRENDDDLNLLFKENLFLLEKVFKGKGARIVRNKSEADIFVSVSFIQELSNNEYGQLNTNYFYTPYLSRALGNDTPLSVLTYNNFLSGNMHPYYYEEDKLSSSNSTTTNRRSYILGIQVKGRFLTYQQTGQFQKEWLIKNFSEGFEKDSIRNLLPPILYNLHSHLNQNDYFNSLVFVHDTFQFDFLGLEYPTYIPMFDELTRGCSNKIGKYCYYAGKIFAEKNFSVQSLNYLDQGCNLNDSTSCNEVGIFKLKNSSKEDYSKYFQKSCELKNSIGCFNLAVSKIKEGHLEEALIMLKKSVVLGLSDERKILETPEFNSLKDNSEFKAIIKALIEDHKSKL